MTVKALFVELSAFTRYRSQYLDDEGLRDLQNSILKIPDAGDLIPGTGGLRKLRHGDANRGKGKRGGVRVIYFNLNEDEVVLLVAVYAKSNQATLALNQINQ
jgi:mRNA-degrading endonuclease RelE of RelBE toxin-antitoxin system